MSYFGTDPGDLTADEMHGRTPDPVPRPAEPLEIKSCPWCGVEPVSQFLHGSRYNIYCEYGGCPINPEMTADTRDEAIERWNRRSPSVPTATQEQRDAPIDLMEWARRFAVFTFSIDGYDTLSEKSMTENSPLSPVQEEATPTLDTAKLIERMRLNVAASRMRPEPEYSQMLAYHADEIAAILEALFGSISERETLTAQNEKAREDSYVQQETIDTQDIRLLEAESQLAEARATVARLTTENGTLRTENDDMQKAIRGELHILQERSRRREQAIHDIEALPTEATVYLNLDDESQNVPCISKSAVLLILREAPTT